MSTVIRPELSTSNRWHISKHRYYELKHYCLQYSDGDSAIRNLVNNTCYEVDPVLSPFLLKGVAYGYSYTYLKTFLGMPCGKNYYYERYRKFFWLLDKRR